MVLCSSKNDGRKLRADVNAQKSIFFQHMVKRCTKSSVLIVHVLSHSATSS